MRCQYLGVGTGGSGQGIPQHQCPPPPKLRIDVELQIHGSLRIYEVLIKGNTKTKEQLIKSYIEDPKRAASLYEFVQAASIAKVQLKGLDIFNTVGIRLESGPPELPGTKNVIIEVTEKNKARGWSIGFPKVGSRSVTGSFDLRNWFGYGDKWYAFLAHGSNQMLDVGAGVSLPRFKRIKTPMSARLSLFSQDWLRLSTFKEWSLGLSLGLLSSKIRDLEYNLYWLTLLDPSQMSSRSVRRQLGHDLLSTLKYGFKNDMRNSGKRPRQGYASASTFQIAGLVSDSRSLHFFK